MDSYNFAADREAQTQTVTFRRVERIEESLPAHGSDADARVGDRHREMIVGDL
jgi:hypothetical protein